MMLMMMMKKPLRLAPFLVHASFACACAYWLLNYKKIKIKNKKNVSSFFLNLYRFGRPNVTVPIS